MDKIELKRKFDSINVWSRGSERAPNKPLLVLMALSNLINGQEQMLGFTDYEEKLRALLKEFGPPRQNYHPEYPFWRLQADELWVVTSTSPLIRRRSNSDPTLSQLRRADVRGGFTTEIFEILSRDMLLVREVAMNVLDAHFPESIHQDILASVGLKFD